MKQGLPLSSLFRLKYKLTKKGKYVKMKKKEKLYEEMVYTMGSSDSSGNSSGSSNDGLLLGTLYFDSNVSTTASNIHNISYSASCANAEQITVTLNKYPSDEVLRSNVACGNYAYGNFYNVTAGDYILKATAQRGTQERSKQSYTPVIDIRTRKTVSTLLQALTAAAAQLTAILYIIFMIFIQGKVYRAAI